MGDKNIELLQENEQMRLNAKVSSKTFKELDKTNNDLAARNLSHNKVVAYFNYFYCLKSFQNLCL